MIDSHVHFWNYHPVKDSWITDEMKVIQQDFTPDDLNLIFKQNGLTACLAVQADQSEEETIFLLSLAKQYKWIKGVVGWIDLRDQNLPQRLAYFSQFNRLKGWRHIVQAEPKGFLKDPHFCNGIALLQQYQYTYDLVIGPQQLKEAIDLVAQFPNQPFVIDHAAKPNIKTGKTEAWQNDLKIIAKNPNVYCKISGLLTEADWRNWQEKEIYTYLDVIFDNFGTERLMFGSDWPVLNLAGQYKDWKRIVELYMYKFTEKERTAVFTTNTSLFYNL
jgi:L-fuconolactonase